MQPNMYRPASERRPLIAHSPSVPPSEDRESSAEMLAAIILGATADLDLPLGADTSLALAQAIAGPPLSADEWFWLSTRFWDARECRYCLRRALAADPGHALAHNSLRRMP